MFSTILLFAVPTDPSKVFNKYVEAMSDDFLTLNNDNKRQKLPMNDMIIDGRVVGVCDEVDGDTMICGSCHAY